MGTAIAIIVFLMILSKWPRLLAAVIGALFFGFIGSLFGPIGMTIGAIIGFFAGITGSDDDDDDDSPSKNKANGTGNNASKAGATNNSSSYKASESAIIRCPSCTKKIRIPMPIKGRIGRCVSCNSKFKISLDDNGVPRAEKIMNRSEGNHKKNNEFTIDECFEILGISKINNSNDVKIAYKSKIREYHPDRVANLGDKLKKVAELESQKINMAYSILKSKGLAK